jgi:membrane protease YdiL (CAAX protease family)
VITVIGQFRAALRRGRIHPVHRRRRPAGVLLACLGTAAAGVLFTVLRQRSGSLLAPVLLHLATNSLGTLAAVAARRLQ